MFLSLLALLSGRRSFVDWRGRLTAPPPAVDTSRWDAGCEPSVRTAPDRASVLDRSRAVADFDGSWGRLCEVMEASPLGGAFSEVARR